MNYLSTDETNRRFAMSYTDKELIRAAQIAYFTVNDVVLDHVRVAVEGSDKFMTIL